MPHEQIGKIWTDALGETTTLGSLVYDAAHDHALVYLKLDALLPVCRVLPEGAVLRCACLPYENKSDVFLCPRDLQVCKTKGKRVRLGYTWSDSNQEGAIHQFRIERDVVLDLWGSVSVHCHKPTEAEVAARSAEKDAAREREIWVECVGTDSRGHSKGAHG